MENKNNKQGRKYNVCVLLIGIFMLFVGVGVYIYLYTPTLQIGLTDSNIYCIYWISLVCSLIGFILMFISICINIYICWGNKSNNDDTLSNNCIKPYIDDLTVLMSKYESVRNRQYFMAILLLLAILSSVLMPYFRNMYKIGLTLSYDYNSLLFSKLNKIDDDQTLFIWWDSIPLFTIFIILCVLLFYMIYRIHNTSHKINLINSTITKVKLYGHNNHCKSNVVPQFGPQSVVYNGIRYYRTIDRRLLTNENGDKIINQNNCIVAMFKIECGSIKYSTDWGYSWYKANAFEHEKEMLSIEKKIQLEINRLTQELNADSSCDIWRAIFNSR